MNAKESVYEMILNAKCIVFDLDDTLLHTSKNAYLKTNKVAAHYNENTISEKDFFESYGKKTLPECIKIWFAGIGEVEFDQVYSSLSKVYPYQPVCDFSIIQDALHNMGKKIGILTNSNFNSSLLKKLKAINLNAELLDYIYTSETVVSRKPSKEAFSKLIHKSGFMPSEVLYFGDSYEDRISCRDAAIKFVPVNTGIVDWKEDDSIIYISSVEELICLVGD